MSEEKVKVQSKWKDPEHIRVYMRERYRAKGLKRHPNILENGKKWSEEHPYGKYETHTEWMQSFKKYYKHSRVEHLTCEVCGYTYYDNDICKEKHLKSKNHTFAVSVVNKMLVKMGSMIC